ncbi:MAG: hypothetical protein AAGA85_24265 [Bacteroidota bacterium]
MISQITKEALPKQPHPVTSYLASGSLLHATLFLFIAESMVYWYFLAKSIQEQHLLWILFWAWSFMFSFIHIFLVLADGWSRFQNYKRAKDQLFLYGPEPKILRQYVGSKCQRIALQTAAKELALLDDIKTYIKVRGYRWYHYIPDFMIADPLFPFRRYFWRRTFLERHYEPRVDYRKLAIKS